MKARVTIQSPEETFQGIIEMSNDGLLRSYYLHSADPAAVIMPGVIMSRVLKIEARSDDPVLLQLLYFGDKRYPDVSHGMPVSFEFALEETGVEQTFRGPGRRIPDGRFASTRWKKITVVRLEDQN